MNRHILRRRARAGFTLPEVMVTLLIVALMCLGVFAGLQTLSKLALNTAVRSEGHRLLQAEAERLTAVPYASFVASGNQTINGALRTTFRAGKEVKFEQPGNSSTARVRFIRRVVEVSSTATTRTLRVEVRWTWQGKTSLISTPLFRTQ